MVKNLTNLNKNRDYAARRWRADLLILRSLYKKRRPELQACKVSIVLKNLTLSRLNIFKVTLE